MRRPLVFLLIGIAAPASAEVYDLIAYEAPGMNPAETIVVIGDARTRLPALLRTCGVQDFRNVPATDGAVVYRFSADPRGKPLACIRENLPPGALLNS